MSVRLAKLVTVQIDDFYTEPTVTASDPWGPSVSKSEFKIELLDRLRSGPLPDDDDLETAISLTRIVRGDLEKYGTSGGQEFTDGEIELAQRTLSAVLARHGIIFRLPWRNFSDFHTYWNQHEGYGSWQRRRDILNEFFGPVRTELDRLEDAAFHAVAAEAVSPHGTTGWPAVDTEIRELIRRFRSATTTQDYRDVGNRSVAVLEALSRTVYDPAKHLRDGEEVPPPDKTKARIGRYVEDSLAGSSNAEIRAVATKVIELAHRVKHSSTPTRRDAGITADSVILLANILRRVDQDF